jgi:plastocyanin
LFVAFFLVGAANVSNANAQNESAPAIIDWSRAQTVQVVMTNYAFTPNALQFRLNTPFHLRLVNNSGHDHSFDAPDFFAAVGTAPEDRVKVVAGEVEVGGGQAVDVKIVPVKPGTYEFQCSHFLHSAFGMTGEALIQS